MPTRGIRELDRPPEMPAASTSSTATAPPSSTARGGTWRFQGGGPLLNPPWQKSRPHYEGPLQLLENQARTAGGAPRVGETGGGRGTVDEAWLKCETSQLDSFHLGWAYWNWNERGPWAFVHEPELWNDLARAYPRATPGILTSLSYDQALGTLQVGFDGLTRGRSLDIAVPSRWLNWQIVSTGSPGSVRSAFDPSARVLRVFIEDTLQHHLVTVRLSS